MSTSSCFCYCPLVVFVLSKFLSFTNNGTMTECEYRRLIPDTNRRRTALAQRRGYAVLNVSQMADARDRDVRGVEHSTDGVHQSQDFYTTLARHLLFGLRYCSIETRGGRETGRREEDPPPPCQSPSNSTMATATLQEQQGQMGASLGAAFKSNSSDRETVGPRSQSWQYQREGLTSKLALRIERLNGRGRRSYSRPAKGGATIRHLAPL